MTRDHCSLVGQCDDAVEVGAARQRSRARVCEGKFSAENHGSAHLNAAASLTFSACPLTLHPPLRVVETVARNGMSSLREVLNSQLRTFRPWCTGPVFACSLSRPCSRCRGVIVFKVDGAGGDIGGVGNPVRVDPELGNGVSAPRLCVPANCSSCAVAAQDRKQAADTGHSPGPDGGDQARHPDTQIIGRAKQITWNGPSVRAGLGRAVSPPHRRPPSPRTRAPRSARKLARRQA